MSDVRPDSEPETEIVPADSGAEGVPEEAGNVPTEVHVHSPAGQRTVVVSELSARTLVSVLDTVQARGSAAKFQLAIAQQELEKGLASLDQPAPPPVPLNRAARRRR